MTLEEINNSDDPEFNMRFWNKYKVGDVIYSNAGTHKMGTFGILGGPFFVSRTADKLKYTLVRVHNKERLEMLKSMVNALTYVKLTDKLKKL